MNPSSQKIKTLLSWSSGKDSAWALHVLRQSPDYADYDVAGLFTTVNARYERVAMHAVRLSVLRRQAEAVGLPLHVIDIPDPCSNEQYAAAMRRFVENAVADGVRCMAFGDLFLQDIRDYREKQLAGSGVTPIFPLWKRPTRELANEMLDAGVRAVVTCVDSRKISPDFAGREWTRELLAEFPPDADPCAENGEFHSLAFAGPMFQRPISIEVGEKVERDGFFFADVI